MSINAMNRYRVVVGVLVAILVLIIWFAHDIALWWREMLFYVQQQQNILHRHITKLLAALRHGHDWHAWWAMVSLGFTYGILHAVGPGHGKAVVSTFLLTQPSGYRSAMGLAVGGALLQGVSAIVWVGATLGVMQWLIRDAIGEVVWAERLSYVLVMVAGGYIVWRQYGHLSRHRIGYCGCGHHHGHDSAQHQPHHLAHNTAEQHHRHHRHDEALHQRHAAQNLSVETSYRSHILALLAIGIRPCSGAILALAVAAGWGLWGIGVAMTFAMALGTALTVLTLALLTVFGRERLAINFSQRSTRWQQWFAVLVLIGGMILVVLGMVMLMATAGNVAGTALPRV